MDRMKVLEHELKTQGIEQYHIWDIVHANSITGSINRSHKQIVQWAKDEGLEKVLIFEDDIKFTDEGAFSYYLSNEPSEYDIYLGGIYLGKIENGIAKEFTAMHCYIVHNRFYDTFLSTDKDKHIDHSLRGIGIYKVCNPMVAIQHNGFSDNSKRHENFEILTGNKNLFKQNK